MTQRRNPPKLISWTEIMGAPEATPGTDMHLTPDSAGCPDCGSTTTHTTTRPTGGTLTWTHPSNECCRASIKREIEWREEEINEIRRATRNDQEHYQHLQAELEAAPARERNRLQQHLDRADRIQAQRNQQRALSIRELRDEIKRLSEKGRTT